MEFITQVKPVEEPTDLYIRGKGRKAGGLFDLFLRKEEAEATEEIGFNLSEELQPQKLKCGRTYL